MKNTTLILTVIIVSLIALNYIPEQVAAQSGIVPENDVVIDEHWLYQFQEEDHKSIQVTEIMWLNNTGDDTFSDNIYFWLPSNADILATCCNAPDMLCILRPDQSHGCFGISQFLNANVITATPFQDYYPYFTPYLSYYGQTEKIIVNSTAVTNQSKIYLDELEFEVTVGGDSKPRTGVPAENKSVEIISERETIGIKWSSNAKYYYINNFETLKLRNNDNVNYTVNLSLKDVPAGWNVTFLLNNREIETINLSANETKELMLFLSVPSYKISVQIEYMTEMETSDAKSTSAVFKKVSLYDTSRVIPVIYKLPDDEISTDEKFLNMFSEYQENYDRELSYYVGGEMEPDDEMQFTYRWSSVSVQKAGTSSAPGGHIIIIIGIFALLIYIIAFLLVRRKKAGLDLSEDDNVMQKEQKQEKKIEKKVDPESKRIAYMEALVQLEDNNKKGVIPDETYFELRSKYRSKIAEMNSGSSIQKTASSGKRDLLLKKKERMLLALKKIDGEYRSGDLPEEIYEELRADYKKKTIDIMKQLEDG